MEVFSKKTTHATSLTFFIFRHPLIGNSAATFGGGVYFYTLVISSLCTGGKIIYENCKLYSNSVHVGGAAVYITTWDSTAAHLFKKCKFIQSNPHSIHYVSTGAVLIYEVDSVEFLAYSFEDSHSTDSI